MDRPHQNTKLANYVVGKGVKLNDDIFHLLCFNSRNSLTMLDPNLEFCTVVDSCSRMCSVILKSLLTFYFQFQ